MLINEIFSRYTKILLLCISLCAAPIMATAALSDQPDPNPRCESNPDGINYPPYDNNVSLVFNISDNAKKQLQVVGTGLVQVKVAGVIANSHVYIDYNIAPHKPVCTKQITSPNWIWRTDTPNQTLYAYVDAQRQLGFVSGGFSIAYPPALQQDCATSIVSTDRKGPASYEMAIDFVNGKFICSLNNIGPAPRNAYQKPPPGQ